MKNLTVSVLVLCGLVGAFVGLALPLVAIGWEAVSVPTESAFFGQRQLGLLLRGVVLFVGAGILAQGIGALLAAGLVGRRWWRPLLVVFLLTTLLTPPYVFAYAWSLRLLPEGVLVGDAAAMTWPSWVVREGRAIACLATWLAPLAACVLAIGWQRSARAVVDLAALDAKGVCATLRVGLPVMWPWMALSLLLTMVLASTEFTIPHLCQAYTWNTEILAALQASDGRAFMLAVPLYVWLLILLVLAYPLRQRMRALLLVVGELRFDRGRSAGRGGPSLFATLSGLAVLALPWLFLVSNLRSSDAFRTSWALYREAWIDSLTAALGTAILAGLVALALDYLRFVAVKRSRVGVLSAGVAMILTLLAVGAALSPPVLVGEATLLTWQHLPAVRDTSLPIVFVGLARFGVIPIFALYAVRLASGPTLAAMARADGATHTAAYFRVVLASGRLPLAAASGVCGLLTLAEVSAAQLVIPPGVSSLGLTLLNEIHFGRNDDIIAITLHLLALITAVTAIAVLAAFVRNRNLRMGG